MATLYEAIRITNLILCKSNATLDIEELKIYNIRPFLVRSKEERDTTANQ